MQAFLQSRLTHWVTVPLAVAALFGAGYWIKGNTLVNHAQATAPVTVKAMTAPSAYITLPNFASIAASQGAAVVNISVTGTVKTAGIPGMDPNDPMFELFRRFQPNLPQTETPMSGLGSGFIVKPDGVILTNAHVVDKADVVTVRLSDKREFQAKVIGVDALTDVAVLKIDAKDLPTVHIGSTKNSNVGDWVVAIGSPFGFDNTVTAGIISAKSRALPDEGYVPFLQTDVAINPGNSGGPLFNLNGEVIGINSQIYSRSGGYQGLSFAIPIDVAMGVEQQLLETGKVSRGRLGIGVQSINQDLASSFGLSSPNGALVSNVEKNGPADQAGLEPGDVIVKFNGQAIDRSSDLPPMVASVKPGSTVSIEVWRSKKLKKLTVRIDEMQTAQAGPAAVPDSQQPKLGVSVRPLNAQELSQTQLKQGLLVEQVSKGPAAMAGIQAGDVILAVNGDQVKSVSQLQDKLSQHAKNVALLVMRGENKIYVPVKIS
ncbi:DegQ family serine endoprotease [Methylophilus medardicus]|uniref:Probable periplasmic serine endoprotease DegP-like n=1 Tax=Methylophilus medardicus TaxID=2588534 RepID=A0A5B8CPW6_9PROT|nr:DegQ family serine endoprotease [Methylophilus medardicus]QDC43249.1 DegQ family serine endoprotease [Methylophilus medardicus]QDC48256.1 DegQ family serine endoprotease [Methylophilus medardicus]QDC51961.1 DegQ family serine endoprotease [Methylophilus medardicus]